MSKATKGGLDGDKVHDKLRWLGKNEIQLDVKLPAIIFHPITVDSSW